MCLCPNTRPHRIVLKYFTNEDHLEKGLGFRKHQLDPENWANFRWWTLYTLRRQERLCIKTQRLNTTAFTPCSTAVGSASRPQQLGRTLSSTKPQSHVDRLSWGHFLSTQDWKDPSTAPASETGRAKARVQLPCSTDVSGNFRHVVRFTRCCLLVSQLSAKPRICHNCTLVPTIHQLRHFLCWSLVRGSWADISTAGGELDGGKEVVHHWL